MTNLDEVSSESDRDNEIVTIMDNEGILHRMDLKRQAITHYDEIELTIRAIKRRITVPEMNNFKNRYLRTSIVRLKETQDKITEFMTALDCEGMSDDEIMDKLNALINDCNLHYDLYRERNINV